MTVYSASFAQGLKPSRDMSISEWAEEFLYMPANNSDAGKFSIHRAPFQKAIMDALTPGNGINEVVWMAGSQTGKTFVGNAWIGHTMHINPQNMLVYEPTITLAETYSDAKVTPMIESTPVLKELFKDKKNNAKSKKKFRNIFEVEFLGANSGNSFRMRSAPYIMADEIDSYPFDVDDEGDPLKLLKARTTTFGKKAKIYYPSTPTIDDFSAIQRKFKEGNQQYYHVPCPHCNAKQSLIFDQLKFERENNEDKTLIADSIYYECAVCKGEIKENKKTWMLSRGEWIADNPDAPKTIVSFHSSSLYSPLGWFSWEMLISEFLDSKDDPFLLKAFKNTRLGECYVEKAQQPSANKLFERAENYEFFEVNEKAVNLFAGIDTQDDRLCIAVIAIGEDGETWVVYYQEIMGSPADYSTWEAIDRVVRRPFKHKTGVELFVKFAAVDTGGHFQTSVYDFVRRNQDKYFAIKGASHDIGRYVKASDKVDIDPRTGKEFSNGLQLILVNTMLIKKYIYINLNNMLVNDKTEGSRVMHFSKDLPKDFYDMLTAEKLIKRITNGVMVEKFVKPKSNTRNEVIDCITYAYAMAFMKELCNLYGPTYKLVWDINIGKRLELLNGENKKEVKQEVAPSKNSKNGKGAWLNKSKWSLR
jgi:phage terminase large subunit GpA-like protein